MPSLSDRSIRLLKVRKIKNNINDLTLSISPALLNGYGGDFDGDSLAMIPVKDARLIEVFKASLSPVYNYISRAHGKYSERMEFIKDYAVVLSELYALGNSEVIEDEE